MQQAHPAVDLKSTLGADKVSLASPQLFQSLVLLVAQLALFVTLRLDRHQVGVEVLILALQILGGVCDMSAMIA